MYSVESLPMDSPYDCWDQYSLHTYKFMAMYSYTKLFLAYRRTHKVRVREV